MRSAATNSCACGVSAVLMQPEERPAARASARATAAPTSAVPSTQVESSACRCLLRSRNQLLAPPGNRSVHLVCAFSPALPCLLGQAYRAWALLWCPQPCDGAPVLGRPGWGTQETLSMCGRSPVSASGVSLHLKSLDKFSDWSLRTQLCPARRGSMCLKEEDSSEEDLADSLYSEIDYII